MRKTVMKARIAIGVLMMLMALGYGLPSLAASRPTQGYLGVDLRDVSDEQVSVLKLKEARGAEVTSVDHDGPACKAGLQVHDVILQMNGTVIEGEEQLRRMLRETPAGRQVTLVVSRDGQPRTIVTQLANREEVERKAWEQHYIVPEPQESGSSSAYEHAGNGFFKSSPASAPTGALKGTHSLLGTSMIVSSAYTGAKLEVMGPQLAEFFGAQGSTGLLVRSVDPNSPAAQAGMKAGDVVIKVNSVPLASGTDWMKTVHENRGKQVSIIVLRDKKEQTLTLTPDSKKRSSLEPGMDFEDFFGFGDEAQQTRATLAQLEPMFNQIADGVRTRTVSPEMQQMIDKVEAHAIDPELFEQTRLQLHIAAVAMQRQLAMGSKCGMD